MSESWAELQWIIPREALNRISSILFSWGVAGIQEDFLPGEAPPPKQPWDTGPPAILPSRILLRGWWKIEMQPFIQRKIQRFCAENNELLEPKWAITREEDWGGDWKENFHRHVIANNLIVSPPWLAQDGDVVIEPGIAFGTGEHPTTYSCLEAIALWARPGFSCLDVGCGSGILALAASKLGMTATGIDIELDAIRSANQNALKNDLSAQFHSRDIGSLHGSYDVVVANLYAEVLSALSSDIIRLCKGKLALAGILFDRHEMVTEAFSSLSIIRKKREGDWISLWYEK